MKYLLTAIAAFIIGTIAMGLSNNGELTECKDNGSILMMTSYCNSNSYEDADTCKRFNNLWDITGGEITNYFMDHIE